MKPQAIEIPVSVFKRGVIVFFGSPEDLIEYLDQRHPVYANELKAVWEKFINCLHSASALTIKLSADPIIYANELIPEEELIHELGHAAKHILSLVKVDDEEAECYTLEYLYEQVMPWFRNLNKKKKSK